MMDVQNMKELVGKLMRVNRLHRNIIQSRAGELKLQRSGHMMLLFIKNSKTPPSQKDIATFFKITPAAVAMSLKKMEAHGLIARAVDENDSRVNHISLSEKGKELLDKTRQGFEAADKAMLSGISDGKNNNIVSNNGDDRYVTITFNNVVTTGRLNPSNAIRNSMDGFVAAEVHSAAGDNPTANTITAKCNIPMTWQSIDIGITESVLNFAIPAFNSTTGEFVIVSSVNIASRGTSTEGLANAYVLPMLTGASIYKDDAVKVAWKGLGTNANAKTEYYVPGTPYVSVAAPTAAEYKLNAVKLVHDKNWNGIPAAGTVMNENINVVPDTVGSV
jgi:DNA-binding MarR family transcriptional regulator